nr:MAG TPA: hypothetical protein [Caudoviricetes sp.]
MANGHQQVVAERLAAEKAKNPQTAAAINEIEILVGQLRLKLNQVGALGTNTDALVASIKALL